MDFAVKKYTKYIKDDAVRSAHQLGRTIGDINNFTAHHLRRFFEVEPAEKPTTFKYQLKVLLENKLKNYWDLSLKDNVFKKLNNELYKLLKCSLASNRAPDEIANGLKSDNDMRDEVVNLLLKRINLKIDNDNQRVFLNDLLYGDQDLQLLLNAQKRKAGFPYKI